MTPYPAGITGRGIGISRKNRDFLGISEKSQESHVLQLDGSRRGLQPGRVFCLILKLQGPDALWAIWTAPHPSTGPVLLIIADYCSTAIQGSTGTHLGTHGHPWAPT